MRRDERQLQRFLRRVDDVTRLVQGLSSADPAAWEEAVAESETRLQTEAVGDEEECETRWNRTAISARAADTHNVKTENPGDFLAALEKDAKERARRRKKNEGLANALKEKGNHAFSKGDYGTAVQRYTEGLEKRKDMPELYTNRAQAYMKLQEYEEAINDCEWALKCNEKCMKAYFHMGKAHLALKHYSESRQCYQKLLELDPQKESLYKGCLNEVDLQEKAAMEEEKALEEFQSGKLTAVSVKELLQKLDRADQNALYYAGGIRLLTEAIRESIASVTLSLNAPFQESKSLPSRRYISQTDGGADLVISEFIPGTEQTLFRTNNGFSIINDNKVIRRGFCAERKNTAEVDLSISLLVLWQAVCTGNEENQRMLLTHPDVNVQLPKLLSSEVPEIQKETLALLFLYSQTENGRCLLLRHQDLTRWLQLLMAFIKVPDTRAICAMNLLTDLMKEEKFKIQCRIKLSTGTLPLFIQMLKTVKLVNRAALAHGIAVMGDLCSDAVIRVQMAESQECWQACLQLMEVCCSDGSAAEYQECLFAVLGLMMNLSLESNMVIQGSAVDIGRKCLSLLSSKAGRIVTRATGILSRVLSTCPSAVDEAVKGGVVKKMMKFLKAGGQITCSYAIKTLAVCTKSSNQAREEVMKSDKNFSVLLQLLASENELIVGNAAFCLSQCLDVPGAASSLLNSNIVLVLLKLAGGDARKTMVQENAAVALGKLCTAEPRHILQLRELNGMAVLSSSVKHVQGL